MELEEYRSTAHATWYCEYHVVFCPKYRQRILTGSLGRLVRDVIREVCGWKGIEITEGHVCRDHVHLCLVVPPKMSVAEAVGTIKGKTSIRVFQKAPNLRRKVRGRSLWSRGYFVSTMGADTETVRAYVRHQERKERRAEQLGMDFDR